jgi:hypothetical protein
MLKEMQHFRAKRHLESWTSSPFGHVLQGPQELWRAQTRRCEGRPGRARIHMDPRQQALNTKNPAWWKHISPNHSYMFLQVLILDAILDRIVPVCPIVILWSQNHFSHLLPVLKDFTALRLRRIVHLILATRTEQRHSREASKSRLPTWFVTFRCLACRVHATFTYQVPLPLITWRWKRNQTELIKLVYGEKNVQNKQIPTKGLRWSWNRW